jgi:hypothetical protein
MTRTLWVRDLFSVSEHTGCAVVLAEVRYDEIGSSEAAFMKATKAAIEGLLRAKWKIVIRPQADWKAMPSEQFDTLLQKELKQLAPDMLKTYEAHATSVSELPCYRSDEYGFERLFVFARDGNRVLVFDDVEDQLAVGELDADGVLRNRGMYGTLTIARMNFSA